MKDIRICTDTFLLYTVPSFCFYPFHLDYLIIIKTFVSKKRKLKTGPDYLFWNAVLPLQVVIRNQKKKFTGIMHCKSHDDNIMTICEILGVTSDLEKMLIFSFKYLRRYLDFQVKNDHLSIKISLTFPFILFQLHYFHKYVHLL